MCSYCSWEQPLPAPVSALQDHIEKECPFHPIRKVEQERAQLRADLEAARTERDDLDYQLRCAKMLADKVGEERDNWRIGYFEKQAERAQSRATEAELRAEVVTWGQIWDDADMLEARLEALRDGTADLGDAQEPRT